VSLIVTNFGAFSGAGSTIVPVEFHAGFYVTGWFQANAAKGCADNDPPPPPGCPGPPNGTYDPTKPPPVPNTPECHPKPNKNKGNVWGYFVTIVPSVPGSIVSEERCVFTELGTCAARLVE